MEGVPKSPSRSGSALQRGQWAPGNADAERGRRRESGRARRLKWAAPIFREAEVGNGLLARSGWMVIAMDLAHL